MVFKRVFFIEKNSCIDAKLKLLARVLYRDALYLIYYVQFLNFVDTTCL